MNPTSSDSGSGKQPGAKTTAAGETDFMGQARASPEEIALEGQILPAEQDQGSDQIPPKEKWTTVKSGWETWKHWTHTYHEAIYIPLGCLFALGAYIYNTLDSGQATRSSSQNVPGFTGKGIGNLPVNANEFAPFKVAANYYRFQLFSKQQGSLALNERLDAEKQLSMILSAPEIEDLTAINFVRAHYAPYLIDNQRVADAISEIETIRNSSHKGETARTMIEKTVDLQEKRYYNMLVNESSARPEDVQLFIRFAKLKKSLK